MSHGGAVLDELLPSVDAVRQDGAIVLLKWDGQRQNRPYTVLITRHDTDFLWRKDTNDMASALAEGLKSYQDSHRTKT